MTDGGPRPTRIRTDGRYLAMVPRPTPEEYRSLKESIRLDGQHAPIIVNGSGVILDGHTRHRICAELKIKPRYETRRFRDRDEEETFVIIANLARRHLTLFGRAEAVQDWMLRERELGKHTGSVGRRQERLHARAARILGCSACTAGKLLYLLLHADEELKFRLREGKVAIAPAYLQAREAAGKPAGWAEGRRAGKKKYMKFPRCLLCGARTIPSDGCHVHRVGCCSRQGCGWGYGTR